MSFLNMENIPTVNLLEELRRRYNCLSKPQGRYIFLGAPGSGKGTQSQELKNNHCLCHLSTGDMLREAVAAGTDIGKKAKSIMDAGDLVGDDIIMGLVKERITEPACQRGFILDGMPRTAQQASSLDKLLKDENMKLDGVFYFDVSPDTLVKRVCGRRVHPSSGRVYHVDFNPPKTPNVDDVTGEPLIHRKDDNETTLRKRLNIFEKETSPLIDYYKTSGLLYHLDASKSSKEISTDIYSHIESRQNQNTMQKSA